MSGSPLNPMKHMSRQGVDPKTVYAATVVDNNDPLQRFRVRVRITDIHASSIDDKYLPWALPDNQHYCTDNGATRSGHVSVPPKGAKVGVRFPLGDPHRPVLAPYPGDANTPLPEALTNYPYRQVTRLENGCYLIVDKSTNEVLIANPGDTHLVILGDCSRTVVGSDTEIVTGSRDDVPSYLLNASDTKISELSAKSAGGVSRGSGNKYVHVRGNYNMIVDGDRTVTIKGEDSLKVGRNRTEKVGGTHKIDSARSETN